MNGDVRAAREDAIVESHAREYTVIIPKDGSWQELENTTVVKLRYRKDGSVLMVRIPGEMPIPEDTVH